MRFLKIYRYDLRQGLLTRSMKWLAVMILSAFLFLCFSLDVFHLFYFDVDGFGGINSLGLSFGDVVLTQTGGILPRKMASVAKEFSFPVKWLFLHALILYFTLSYTSDDLTRCGMQVITRTGSKWAWWLSKCLWNLTAVASYYLASMGTLFLLCVATGKAPGMTLNSAVFMAPFAELLPEWAAAGREMFLALCVMPCVVGITLNIVQMVLTLYIKPIIAYILVCVYLIAGVFYVHPSLLSNYALTVRSQAVGFYALNCSDGLIICTLICLAAVVVGGIRMQKMDLIQEA